MDNGSPLPAHMPSSPSPPLSSSSVQGTSRRSQRFLSATNSSSALRDQKKQKSPPIRVRPTHDPVLEQIGGYESDGDDRFIMPSNASQPKTRTAAPAIMKRKREASDDFTELQKSNAPDSAIDLPVAKKAKTDAPSFPSTPRMLKPKSQRRVKENIIQPWSDEKQALNDIPPKKDEPATAKNFEDKPVRSFQSDAPSTKTMDTSRKPLAAMANAVNIQPQRTGSKKKKVYTSEEKENIPPFFHASETNGTGVSHKILNDMAVDICKSRGDSNDPRELSSSRVKIVKEGAVKVAKTDQYKNAMNTSLAKFVRDEKKATAIAALPSINRNEMRLVQLTLERSMATSKSNFETFHVKLQALWPSMKFEEWDTKYAKRIQKRAPKLKQETKQEPEAAFVKKDRTDKSNEQPTSLSKKRKLEDGAIEDDRDELKRSKTAAETTERTLEEKWYASDRRHQLPIPNRKINDRRRVAGEVEYTNSQAYLSGLFAQQKSFRERKEEERGIEEAEDQNARRKAREQQERKVLDQRDRKPRRRNHANTAASPSGNHHLVLPPPPPTLSGELITYPPPPLASHITNSTSYNTTSAYSSQYGWINHDGRQVLARGAYKSYHAQPPSQLLAVNPQYRQCYQAPQAPGYVIQYDTYR